MKIGTFELTGHKPAIMGIVNVTPDSFSDGGKFANSDAAISHAFKLIEEGADIIDIGGESTRPGSLPVSEEEEIRRVIPIIKAVRRKSNCAISVDTTKSNIAMRALEAGADMINDISAGRFDPAIFGVAAKAGVPICLMHMRGTPRTMQENPHYDDVMAEISAFLSDAIERAVAAGVSRNNIMIDPGIGFGKTVEDNITILRSLADLGKLGAPIVIGTSRKYFIGKVLDVNVNNRLEGTLATLAVAISNGVSILRVHDVGPTKKFVTMYCVCRT